MTNKSKAPYSHSDGSNCWTKGCSRGNQTVDVTGSDSLIYLDTASHASRDVQNAIVDILRKRAAGKNEEANLLQESDQSVNDYLLTRDAEQAKRKDLLKARINAKTEEITSSVEAINHQEEATKRAITKIMEEHDKAVSAANLFSPDIEYSQTNPINARKLTREYFGAEGYSTNGDSVVYLSLLGGDKVFIEMDTQNGNQFRADVGLYTAGGKHYVNLTKHPTTIKNGPQLKIYADEALKEAKELLRTWYRTSGDTTGMYSEYDRAGS